MGTGMPVCRRFDGGFQLVMKEGSRGVWGNVKTWNHCLVEHYGPKHITTIRFWTVMLVS